ncbi:protein angel-like isoform X2 [Anticarsia gemmatalis]|uniref:protein angel-like isoform X2 n=1 Tax=Anticarsia gemmatalis TaxID=129554 RepID=UPI003F76CF6E
MVLFVRIYLWFTCEKVNKTHVRRYTHFINKRRICSSENTDIILRAQVHSSLVLRQHGPGKKRSKIKIPPFDSDGSKKNDPMSKRENFQPTTKHVCYGGGKFDVSEGRTPVTPFQTWIKTEVPEEPPDPGQSRREIPRDFRVWEPVGRRNTSTENCETFQFKVLSYNVLAQYLLECHPYLYTGCDPDNLKWRLRSSRIYEEIVELAPDILCLQEVQSSHIADFYNRFNEIGYVGIFKQKTGQRQDGCAIYYKSSRFHLVEQIHVEFFQPELPILNRDNIGMMVKLMPVSLPSSPIVVATTHLLYNPKRTDVRLAQMQVFLAEIDRFAYCNNGLESGHLPIILTGDFNSTPDSAVVRLLDSGTLMASPFRDASDWERIGVTDNCQHLSVYLNRQEGLTTEFRKTKIYNSEYSNIPPVGPEPTSNRFVDQFSELFNSDTIGHSLRLRSVYDKYKHNETPEATTFQEYWVTVDYIYFSYCTSLKLVERLRLPTAAECEVLGRLPNEVYGSDHLALAATFQLRSYGNQL